MPTFAARVVFSARYARSHALTDLRMGRQRVLQQSRTDSLPALKELEAFVRLVRGATE